MPPVVPVTSGVVRLHFIDEQPMHDRRAVIVHAANAVADIMAPGRAKIRVSILVSQHRVIHLKAMSCFIAPVGGRASSAMQLDRDGSFDLVSPNSQILARGHLVVAIDRGTSSEFTIPGVPQLIVFDKVDCSDPICVDFGPGFTSYFVYTQGRPLPKPRRG
jgi:hypothetical protein